MQPERDATVRSSAYLDPPPMGWSVEPMNLRASGRFDRAGRSREHAALQHFLVHYHLRRPVRLLA